MSKVVSIDAFKKSKTEEARYEPKTTEDFKDRMSRIKASLEKIDKLMTELKKMSTVTSKKPTRKTDEEII
jgi:hypothetical protein